MNIKRLGLVLTVVGLVLFLVTTYLALFYAPLPGTSVKSANDIISTVEGHQIKVAGFATNISVNISSGLDASSRTSFSLADFSDFQRYLDASSQGNLSDDWWTVRPIDVVMSWGGWLGDDPDILGNLHNGTNVSVMGTVEHRVVGPNSAITGFSLSTGTSGIEAGSSGSFSIMTAPIAQKIFYFHMPSAWVAYVAFFITLVASIMYLRSKELKYDRIAMASAELGVLFATVAIATGPIWAKQEWGVYWRWDDTKLVTTFVMWLVYIGYLSLRAALAEPTVRARISSVYGIIGFVTMPMSLLSARIGPLLRSSHPEVIASSSGSLSPEAGISIGVAVVAFTILFAAMLIKRIEVAESEEEIEELKRVVGGEE